MWWKFSFAHDNEPWYMWCTYGMSGQWGTSQTKHSSFEVKYNQHGQRYFEAFGLWFNDIRHFGTLKFVRGENRHKRKLNTLGPCVLTGAVTPEIFAEKILNKPNRTIAEALLDQSAISGIGNYMRAEALFRAGISPWRSVTEITTDEYVTLCKSVLSVAQESYKSQGATISTYRNVDGAKGTTQFSFQVYSRKSCPKGHEIIKEETPEGRTSHWCKHCQK